MKSVIYNPNDKHAFTVIRTIPGRKIFNTSRNGAITFALILQKFRLRLSYTCAHKCGAFALSFGVTLARIFSHLFPGQLLVFEPRC